MGRVDEKHNASPPVGVHFGCQHSFHDTRARWADREPTGHALSRMGSGVTTPTFFRGRPEVPNTAHHSSTLTEPEGTMSRLPVHPFIRNPLFFGQKGSSPPVGTSFSDRFLTLASTMSPAAEEKYTLPPVFGAYHSDCMRCVKVCGLYAAHWWSVTWSRWALDLLEDPPVCLLTGHM